MSGIYVPLHLNADQILMQNCNRFIGDDGQPESYERKGSFLSKQGKIISQLEIYDQVWVARKDLKNAVRIEERLHSTKGNCLSGDAGAI